MYVKQFGRNAFYALILFLCVIWMKRVEKPLAREINAYINYVLHTDFDPAPVIDHLLRVWHAIWPLFSR